MKNHGSLAEYSSDRTQGIMSLYRSYLDSCEYIHSPDVFEFIANAPAPRFYVSASRATIVVTGILRGDKLLSMRPNKREMFFEICRRYMELHKLSPNASMPQLIQVIIEQPAPKFYLAPGSVRAIILRQKRLRRHQRRRHNR